MSLDQYAGRVRQHFDGDPRITEKRAFGSIMFLLNGNMLAAVKRDGDMLVHLAREDVEAGLAREGATQMVQGGRRMTGFLWVAAYATETDEDFGEWLEFATRSTAKLPPKSRPGKSRPGKSRSDKSRSDRPAPRKPKSRGPAG